MTEWKSKVPYSSSSQSSIAALKDVLEYGRLMSSHPLRPPSPSGAPTDHPYTLSLYLLGRSVGRQKYSFLVFILKGFFQFKSS